MHMVDFYLENPLLARQQEEIRSILSPAAFKKNPFRKDSSFARTDSKDALDQQTGDGSAGGIALIDAWKKPAEKTAAADFKFTKSTGRKSKGKDKSASTEEKTGATKTKKITLKNPVPVKVGFYFFGI